MAGEDPTLLPPDSPTPQGRLLSGFESLGSGLLRHPLLGPALDRAAYALGVPRSRLNLLEKGVGVNEPYEKILAAVGQYGPDFALGYGAYLAGARLGLRAMTAVAAARDAQEGTQLGALLARASRDRAIAALTAKSTGSEVAAALGTEMRMPFVGRLGQSIGGNLGIGAYEGSRSLAMGKSAPEAAKDAAIASVLGAGLEMGLVGAAKALTGRARMVDIAAVEGRAKPLVEDIERQYEAIFSGPPGRVAGERTSLKEAPIVELDERLNEVLGVREQMLAIREAQGKLTRGQLKQLRRAERAIPAIETRIMERETQQLSLANVLGQEGSFSYLSDRPFSNRGLLGTIRGIGRQLWLTPEGLREGFGGIGSRVLSAAQQADESALLQKSLDYEFINQKRARFVELLGLNPRGREAETSGLLVRLQGVWEDRAGSGRETLSRWLQTLPDEQFEIRTLGTPKTMVENEAGELVEAAGPAKQTKNFQWSKVLPRRLTPAEADEAAEIFEQVKFLMNEHHAAVREVGGLPALTEEQLRKLGVRAHMTHLFEPGLSDSELAQRLLRNYTPEQAQAILNEIKFAEALPSQREAAALNRASEGTVKGFYNRIGKLGTFDHGRVIRGTAWEKHLAGLPVITDPFRAAIISSRYARHRVAMASVFGPKGELAEVYGRMVQQEALAANQQLGLTFGQRIAQRLGQNVQPETELNAANTKRLFMDVVNELLDNKYYDESLTKLAKTFTSVNVGSKMTLGVFSNMAQPANNALLWGVTNSTRGMWHAIKGLDPITGQSLRRSAPLGRDLYNSVAMPHAMFHGMSGALDAGVLSQRSERVAEWLLRYTGFSAAETMNRLGSGITARFVFKDLVSRASQGRLRGTNLDWAQRTMADLGVNLADEAGRLKQLGPERYFTDERTLETVQRVTFAGAQKTQFIPSRFRKPIFWQHPVGRVVFQFKTFALHQSRLFRDQVLAEFANGNVKPFATAMAIAPLSGEFVASMKELITDRHRREDLMRHPVGRAADNVLYFGGFGMAGDLYQALVHGDLGSYAGGPTVDTVWKALTGIAKMDKDQALRAVDRLPAWDAMKAMWSVADPISEELLHRWTQWQGDGLHVQSLDDLRVQDAQQKSFGGPGGNPLK